MLSKKAQFCLTFLSQQIWDFKLAPNKTPLGLPTSDFRGWQHLTSEGRRQIRGWQHPTSESDVGTKKRRLPRVDFRGWQLPRVATSESDVATKKKKDQRWQHPTSEVGDLRLSAFKSNYKAKFLLLYLSLGVSICLDVISIEISISTPKKS